MKSLFDKIACSVAFLATAILGPLAAQETPTAYGFLNVVNATPWEKPCKIELAGKDLNPDGLAAATATGWFMIPTGNSGIVLNAEGLDKASGSVDVAEGQSQLLVIFLEPNPRKDPDGKPLPPKMKIKRCNALDNDLAKSGFYLKMISLCPGENRFVIGQKPFVSKLFEEVEIPNWSGGGFEINFNQKPIGQISMESEKGPFYLFIGTDNLGKYCSLTVRAEKQGLPPWMQKAKKTNP